MEVIAKSTDFYRINAKYEDLRNGDGYWTVSLGEKMPTDQDNDELKLVECLAAAGGKMPFRVRVSSGGGEFQQDHVLEIKKVGVSVKPGHEGELTYDFHNETTNSDHRLWRHDSCARFELIEKSDELPDLPEDLQQAIDDGGFCEQEAVEKIVKLVLKRLTKAE